MRFDATGQLVWHSPVPVKLAGEVADGFVVATESAAPFWLVHIDAVGNPQTLAVLPSSATSLLLVADGGVLAHVPRARSLVDFALDGTQRWTMPDDVVVGPTRESRAGYFIDGVAAPDAHGGFIVGGSTTGACFTSSLYADYQDDGTKRWQASTLGP
jgi:outer membrane protein assembly factor BamB